MSRGALAERMPKWLLLSINAWRHWLHLQCLASNQQRVVLSTSIHEHCPILVVGIPSPPHVVIETLCASHSRFLPCWASLCTTP